MPTKQMYTAVVITEYHLIVAVGRSGSNGLNTVEVMDVQALVWSTAANVPPSSLLQGISSHNMYTDLLYILEGCVCYQSSCNRAVECYQNPNY